MGRLNLRKISSTHCDISPDRQLPSEPDIRPSVTYQLFPSISSRLPCFLSQRVLVGLSIPFPKVVCRTDDSTDDTVSFSIVDTHMCPSTRHSVILFSKKDNGIGVNYIFLLVYTTFDNCTKLI